MPCTDMEIQTWKNKIDNMSHRQMAYLWRFAPIGHLVFNMQSPLADYFYKRFDELGGMTTKISKEIGFEHDH